MQQNFTLISGDIDSALITVKNSAGNAVNIATDTPITWDFFPITASGVSAVAALSLSLSSGLALTTDGSNGQITASFSAANTASLSGKYYHEMRTTEADSDEFTIMTGRVSILADRNTG